MNFQAWKDRLANEIETAAEWRAEKAVLDRHDPDITASQAALFELANRLRALPADDGDLRALFSEEMELSQLDRSQPGEAEQRYRATREDLLRSIGFDHPPFADAGAFLATLRRQVDETIAEFRLA